MGVFWGVIKVQIFLGVLEIPVFWGVFLGFFGGGGG